MLIAEFGPYPIVHVQPLKKKQTIEEAVRDWVQYAHMPVKAKDSSRQPHLCCPDALAQFVIVDGRPKAVDRVAVLDKLWRHLRW